MSDYVKPPTPPEPSNAPSPPSAAPPPVPPRQQDTGPYQSPYGGGGVGYTPYSGAGAVTPYGGLYGAGGMYGTGYGAYGYGAYSPAVAAPVHPGGEASFVQAAEENSRAAFQSIQSIVHAVSSISMMLESTYGALYSSFRAVIGVADHFARMRATLVHVFSTLAVVRTVKWLAARLLVLARLRRSDQVSRDTWHDIWFSGAADAVLPDEDGDRRGSSSWPIFMFLSVALGGPWLIWRLLSRVGRTARRSTKRWATGEDDHFVARALYDFTTAGAGEAGFSKGQLLRVAPKEEQPRVRGWLLAAVADGGKPGLVPYNYIKVLGKRKGTPPGSSVAEPGVSRSAGVASGEAARSTEEQLLTTLPSTSKLLSEPATEDKSVQAADQFVSDFHTSQSTSVQMVEDECEEKKESEEKSA